MKFTNKSLTDFCSFFNTFGGIFEDLDIRDGELKQLSSSNAYFVSCDVSDLIPDDNKSLSISNYSKLLKMLATFIDDENPDSVDLIMQHDDSYKGYIIYNTTSDAFLVWRDKNTLSNSYSETVNKYTKLMTDDTRLLTTELSNKDVLRIKTMCDISEQPVIRLVFDPDKGMMDMVIVPTNGGSSFKVKSVEFDPDRYILDYKETFALSAEIANLLASKRVGNLAIQNMETADGKKKVFAQIVTVVDDIEVVMYHRMLDERN